VEARRTVDHLVAIDRYEVPTEGPGLCRRPCDLLDADRIDTIRQSVVVRAPAGSRRRELLHDCSAFSAVSAGPHLFAW
jgi:hypothetical protein